MPRFPAVVITGGGQRLLLEHTDARISYNSDSGAFETNKPGWWFINYPVDRIANLPSRSVWEDWISIETGLPSSEVKNWYFQAKGTPPPEPSAPEGPAPFIPTPNPTRVVNQEHPKASDSNPGTLDAPFATIGKALSGAREGDVIHVYPGLYRESLLLAQSATREKPLRVEGIRDANGRMPIVTGNDPIPAAAWSPVSGLDGVYRAPMGSSFLMGTASVDISGKNATLVERSYPDALQEGEYAFNRGSHRLLETISLDPMPKAGDTLLGRSWRRVTANSEGYIDFEASYGAAAAKGILWMVAHVWLDPIDTETVWNPDYPAPITGKNYVDGPFRAGRMAGAPMNDQVNPYRIWLNGKRLHTRLHAFDQETYDSHPRVSFDWGMSDTWHNFRMQEGWNTVVLQLDTSLRTNDLRLRFGTPNDRQAISSANPPSSNSKPSGTERSFISEFLILDPVAAGELDNAIYVRLPGNADPREHQVDLAARKAPLVNISGRHIHLRGFEIRHGSHFQQTGTVSIAGPANRLEGNFIHSGEKRGVNISPIIDSDGPLLVRNNWIFNHGHLGIGGGGRGGAIVDYNVVADYNWGGYERLWESGGIKLFRMTETIIRHNEVSGIGGPAIWLDWENFHNRVEGNFTHNHWGFSVGVEASPGPNLVASNLSVDMQPGYEWFRAHVLVWDSIRTWSAHNTVNGIGKTGNFWNGTDANRGLATENINNRGTIFDPFPDFRDTRYFNNLVVGAENAVVARTDDPRGGNYTDYGTGATPASLLAPSNPLDIAGYRPQAIGAAGLETAPDGSLDYIRHDFYGLLRFAADRWAPGAFRVEPAIPDDAAGLLEVELNDGQMHRAALHVEPPGAEEPPLIPSEPAASAPELQLRRVTQESVELQWSAWPEMDEVVLERSSNLEEWTPLGTFTDAEASFVDMEAALGTVFYYRLLGRDASGEFAVSHPVGRLLEDWLHAHLGLISTENTYEDSSAWEDTADPDGDGFPLLLEYYLDLDPRTPHIENWNSQEVDGDLLRIVYERARMAPDVIAQVVWSPDLAEWSSEGIVTKIISQGLHRERVEASITKPGSGAVFLRIELRRRDDTSGTGDPGSV